MFSWLLYTTFASCTTIKQVFSRVFFAAVLGACQGFRVPSRESSLCLYLIFKRSEILIGHAYDCPCPPRLRAQLPRSVSVRRVEAGPPRSPAWTVRSRRVKISNSSFTGVTANTKSIESMRPHQCPGSSRQLVFLPRRQHVQRTFAIMRRAIGWNSFACASNVLLASAGTTLFTARNVGLQNFMRPLTPFPASTPLPTPTTHSAARVAHSDGAGAWAESASAYHRSRISAFSVVSSEYCSPSTLICVAGSGLYPCSRSKKTTAGPGS